MNHSALPYLIDLPAVGDDSIGFISVAAEAAEIPFPIRRVFWTHGTPEHVTRGRHAHHRTEIVLVAVIGRMTVFTELPTGETGQFILDRPTRALYLPPSCWRTLTYASRTVQLSLASTDYEAEDYIRDYDAFRRLSPTLEKGR